MRTELATAGIREPQNSIEIKKATPNLQEEFYATTPPISLLSLALDHPLEKCASAGQ